VAGVAAWSADRWMGIAGLILGFIGVAATIWAAYDGRRQRGKRETAVIAANAVVERTYGLLIGMKPAIATLGQSYEAAVNDGLDAINERRDALSKL
jgi:hypothetical protein